MTAMREQISRSARDRATADFFELSKRIRASALLDRRYGWYIARAVILAVGLVIITSLLFGLGRTPWQLLNAVAFALLLTQVAFFGHDAAHHPVLASGRRNEWLSRVVANLVVGLSHGWWTRKHGRHHAHPNTIGKDDDIATGALVFDPDDVPRRTGLVGWITRHQGWLFFPMLTLEGLNLHISGIRPIIRDPQMEYRRTEAALIAVRLAGFPLLVLFVLGPALGAGFLGIQLMVFGIYMGACFAPNHKGMPLLPGRAGVNFLQRQVLTSRNIRGGRVMSWAMGGLNYQIEHHLFPRMPSVNLRRAQPIVRDCCAERGIPYTETGLLDAYGTVIRYLNRVGLGHSDPFECPLVTAYRPTR